MLALGKILDDFLSLAKIEDGRMELELVDVNIAAWLHELTTIFAFALRSKRLQLHVLVDPSMPRSIYVDGNRLRQVVSNYLSNAIKFSSADGVVTVELLVVCRELCTVLLIHPQRVHGPTLFMEPIEQAPRVRSPCVTVSFGHFCVYLSRTAAQASPLQSFRCSFSRSSSCVRVSCRRVWGRA